MSWLGVGTIVSRPLTLTIALSLRCLAPWALEAQWYPPLVAVRMLVLMIIVRASRGPSANGVNYETPGAMERSSRSSVSEGSLF